MEESVKTNWGGVLLSIVIPVYNREQFIEECLDSIVNQPVDKSLYEIICIDDGSKDNSLSILKSYEGKYSNIKVFSQENQGASSARNHGIDKATGKYLWFVDSDDYIYNNALVDIINTLRTYAPELMTIDVNIDLNETTKIIVNKNIPASSFVCGNIILLDIINQQNIRFDKNIIYGEDTVFWYQAYIYCERIIKLQKPIYYYRKHGDTIISRGSSFENINKRVVDVIQACKIFLGLLDNVLKKEKRKNVQDKIKDLTEFLLDELFPFTNLSYKEFMKELKSLKLYPYKFRAFTFKMIFKIKGLKKKGKQFFMWLYPIEWVYKIVYKIKHKKTKNLG